MQELGLSHLWTQGDVVTRATAILLLLMSLASWIVIQGVGHRAPEVDGAGR